MYPEIQRLLELQRCMRLPIFFYFFCSFQLVFWALFCPRHFKLFWKISENSRKKSWQTKSGIFNFNLSLQMTIWDPDKNLVTTFCPYEVAHFRFHVRKSNSGIGESFTSDWKLNRQKGYFSELADSFVVTVNFSLQICSIGSRLSKNFK